MGAGLFGESEGLHLEGGQLVGARGAVPVAERGGGAGEQVTARQRPVFEPGGEVWPQGGGEAPFVNQPGRGAGEDAVGVELSQLPHRRRAVEVGGAAGVRQGGGGLAAAPGPFEPDRGLGPQQPGQPVVHDPRQVLHPSSVRRFAEEKNVKL